MRQPLSRLRAAVVVLAAVVAVSAAGCGSQPTASSAVPTATTTPTATPTATPTPTPAPTPTSTPAATPAPTPPPAPAPVATPVPAPPPPPPTAPPPAPPPAAPVSCHPLSNSGTCYEPGEFCRNSDHGVTGLAGDGKTIVCEDDNGWRWEPV